MPFLRFGWQACVCGKLFSVEHAFSCLCGGFSSISHNEIPDLTVSLLSEVCCDVGFELVLQPLDRKPIRYNMPTVKMVLI